MPYGPIRLVRMVMRVEAVAEEHSIPLKTIHIISREQAQNTPAPVTTYALFKDG